MRHPGKAARCAKLLVNLSKCDLRIIHHITASVEGYDELAALCYQLKLRAAFISEHCYRMSGVLWQ